MCSDLSQDESTRLSLEQTGLVEKVKENKEKIKLSNQLPYLVGNIVEVLDVVPEDNEVRFPPVFGHARLCNPTTPLDPNAFQCSGAGGWRGGRSRLAASGQMRGAEDIDSADHFLAGGGPRGCGGSEAGRLGRCQ